MGSPKALIDHPKFRQAFEGAHAHLSFTPEELIVVIVGLGGAGKTTLVSQLQLALSHPETVPGSVESGVLYTSCVTQSSGQFDWEDWFVRALMALKEPLMHEKRKLNTLEEEYLAREIRSRNQKRREAAFRLLFERALFHRKISLLTLDEAHSIARLLRVAACLGVLESLKSLTIAYKQALLLAGTYDLHHLLVLNGQLARRIEYVHLDCYDADVPDERRAYAAAVKGLFKQLRLPVSAGQEWTMEFLYKNSGGAVGRSWSLLERAQARALRARAQSIRREDIERGRLRRGDLETLAAELSAGRSAMEEKKSAEVIKADEARGTSEQPKQRRKPGRRNPKRDPVGTTHNSVDDE